MTSRELGYRSALFVCLFVYGRWSCYVTRNSAFCHSLSFPRVRMRGSVGQDSQLGMLCFLADNTRPPRWASAPTASLPRHNCRLSLQLLRGHLFPTSPFSEPCHRRASPLRYRPAPLFKTCLKGPTRWHSKRVKVLVTKPESSVQAPEHTGGRKEVVLYPPWASRHTNKCNSKCSTGFSCLQTLGPRDTWAVLHRSPCYSNAAPENAFIPG